MEQSDRRLFASGHHLNQRHREPREAVRFARFGGRPYARRTRTSHQGQRSRAPACQGRQWRSGAARSEGPYQSGPQSQRKGGCEKTRLGIRQDGQGGAAGSTRSLQKVRQRSNPGGSFAPSSIASKSIQMPNAARSTCPLTRWPASSGKSPLGVRTGNPVAA